MQKIYLCYAIESKCRNFIPYNKLIFQDIIIVKVARHFDVDFVPRWMRLKKSNFVKFVRYSPARGNKSFAGHAQVYWIENRNTCDHVTSVCAFCMCYVVLRWIGTVYLTWRNRVRVARRTRTFEPEELRFVDTDRGQEFALIVPVRVHSMIKESTGTHKWEGSVN